MPSAIFTCHNLINVKNMHLKIRFNLNELTIDDEKILVEY